MASVKERLQERPLDRSGNPNRTHQLKPPLHQKAVAGQALPQWQHEMTSSGRIWHCPDKESLTVWVTRVSLDPPKETHRGG
jgi:hypothetical protein